MKSVCSFVPVSFSASNSQGSSRRLQKRAGLAISRVFALLALMNAAMLAAGQTAHFDGAQNSPVIKSNGVQILAIAVDAAGDEFFTAQNAEMQLAFQPGRSVRYVPAAFHPNSTRRLSDGGHSAIARKSNASSCTYEGTGSGLFVRLANSSTIYQVQGLNAPMGLAIDPLGDLYVLDAYTGLIFKYAGANGSVQIEPVTGGGVTLNGPTVVSAVQGNTCAGGLMASDSHGNLYYTTLTGNTVEEVEAVNGMIPSSPTTRSLGSGYDFAAGIAVDSSGDVYVASAENNTVEEMVAVNGSIPASPTIRTLGSGFSLPAAVAVDSQGDVYVGDFQNNELKELVAVNGSIPSSPTIEILGSFNEIEAVTLDQSGDIFASYVANNGSYIAELTPSGANFGQINVGTASSATIPMDFTFDTGGTLGGISVLTQGTSGLDYSNGGSGTCTAGAIYSPGQTCTVNVTFTPKFSGTRDGAVVLTASNGSTIATGYVQGTGVGALVSFTPETQVSIPVSGNSAPLDVAIDGAGNLFVVDNRNQAVVKETFSAGNYTQTTIASGLSDPRAVAVDGAGNVYIADTGNSRVLEESPTAHGYAQSTVDSGIGFPYGVTVDGSGNVYIADNENNRILKETPSSGSYTRSTAVSGLSGPLGIAVDGNGNLYIAADSSGPGTLLKESLSDGVYSQSTIPVAGEFAPQGIAVDGAGNVYFVDGMTDNIFKETSTPNGYVESTITSNLHIPSGPWGITVDADGNVYTGYPALNQVVKIDLADPPELSFASTAVGSTSTDSPQIVTIENNGNAALTFPIPVSGNNPAIGPDFTLNENAPNSCPVITSASSTAGTLAPGANCALSISFSPTGSGALNETLALTDNNLNAAAPAYATQSVSLSGTGMATPVITWAAPAAITYGTALSTTQLNATANVSGTFSYSPAAGTILTAGTQTITVSFTPTDTTDYTAATATVTLTVNQATPSITWAAPAAITYGSGLGSGQLNASSTVAGTFSYSPGVGTVLTAGQQTLTATFTPTDTADYTTATATVPLTVNQATPTITWSSPAAITYGTALAGAQLDATASVPGTFIYSPAAGTVLTAGQHTITATFMPTDTTDYTLASATVVLTVNQATLTINWSAPAAVSYGTALSSTQLNASSTVAGTLSYSPAAGTVLTAGTHTLSVTFTPADTTDYTTATATVTLTVNQAAPVITWAAPAAITYGTALNSAQLNATANVAGVFSYSPAAGTVLAPGTQMLTATFTPTDTTDYTAATASVSLTVVKATPAVSWPAPSAIIFGTALSAAQLDATANVAGSFTYSPAAGTVLSAGSQTLSVTFTPSNSTDYNSVTTTVTLTVNKATPTITWTTPASIAEGTALSSTQLDAKSSVAGTFVYSPSAGTVLAAGNQTLTTTFTPTNSTDYNTATDSVVLAVKGFTLSASSKSLTVTPGKTGTDTIAVTDINGFNSRVTLSASGLPFGVTVTFGTNPATGSSVLTFTVGKSAGAGTYTVTVQGVSGSSTASTTISLTI